MTTSTLIVMKLVISALFGVIIGIERELKRKPAGIKTALVISVASCLLTIVSIESATRYSELTDRTMMDPLRLAAQIVSGIGFLGAGVILRRSNDVISGLTTAAIIWTAAGFGIAIGAGFFIEATIGLILIMSSVKIMPWIAKGVGPKTLRERELKLKLYINENEFMTEILKTIKSNNIRISHVKVKDVNNGLLQLEMRAIIDDKLYTTDLYNILKKIDHVEL